MTTFTEEQIKEANTKIAEHINTAYAEISAAEKIADEYGLEFSWDLAYGMGGWYTGKNAHKEEWEEFDEEDEESYGWKSSSQSC